MTKRTRRKTKPEPQEKKAKQISSRRKNALGHATSLLLIGGALLTSTPCQANDYELPYIKVEKKPEASAEQRHYEESSQKAKAQAKSISEKEKISRPDAYENYYDSILLDFKSLDQNVAITNCGYCQCSSCYCSSCSTCSDCGKSACHCSCDCDCSI